MEHRLQNGHQAPRGHLRGNAFCDSWNTQRPRPTIRLRNIDPPHRRRKNSSLTTVGSRACRGCPKGWPQIPQSTVRLFQPLPWLAFTRLKASQTSRLGMSNGFTLPTRAPPGASWPVASAEQAQPHFAPAPLQDPHHYYGLLRACLCSALVLSPSRSRIHLWLVASPPSGVTEPRVLTFHTQAWSSFASRLHAGCRSGRIRHPPSSSRRKGHPPVTDIA